MDLGCQIDDKSMTNRCPDPDLNVNHSKSEVPDLDLNVNHSNLEGPDPDLNVNHSKSEVPDPDLNVIHSGFGGPDPQIGRFWTHLGSKSGGAGLAGLPNSLCTVVQPARMAVRRGQNPSRIMTKMGYFGGPDPQIACWSCFGNMESDQIRGFGPPN